MQKGLSDILKLDDVKGVIFFSLKGDLLYREFGDGLQEVGNFENWYYLMQSLGDAEEADLLFTHGRCYIRKSEKGYLFILSGPSIPVAKLRLHSDVLISSIEKQERSTKKFRLFGKNRS